MTITLNQLTEALARKKNHLGDYSFVLKMQIKKAGGSEEQYLRTRILTVGDLRTRLMDDQIDALAANHEATETVEIVG